VASLPRDARDAAPLAPRGRTAQVASVATPARPGPPSHERGAGGADRAEGRQNLGQGSELAVRAGCWSADFTVASSTGPPTAPSWPPSAGCFLGNAGEPSWSRRRRCSVGTTKPDGASGERGVASAGRGARL
jgi:hypothetical protein